MGRGRKEGRERKGSRFFFEKKNQKTFVGAARCWSGLAVGATAPAPQAFGDWNACGAAEVAQAIVALPPRSVL
jgi:hypothetical protein